jgi:hypothetical protein
MGRILNVYVSGNRKSLSNLGSGEFIIGVTCWMSISSKRVLGAFRYLSKMFAILQPTKIK